MVGLWFLVPAIGVRVPDRQPLTASTSWVVIKQPQLARDA